MPGIMWHSGFDNYTYFKERFRNDRNHWHWPFGQLWNTKELDDCGYFKGAAVIGGISIGKKQEYLDYIHTAAKHTMRRGQIAWMTAH